MAEEEEEVESDNPEDLNRDVPILFSPWEGELDLTTKTGKLLWDEGIRPLENKFTGYGKDLARFLADVKNRQDKCKWTNILTIGGKNLLKHYGEVDLAEVKAERHQRDRAPVRICDCASQIHQAF